MCTFIHELLFAERNMEPTTISITLFPRYGSVLGGSLIQVFGPCFDSLINSSITCHFDEIETRGFYADEDYIVCVSPSLEIVGRVGFKITVAEFQIESEEVAFHSCKSKCKIMYTTKFVKNKLGTV